MLKEYAHPHTKCKLRYLEYKYRTEITNYGTDTYAVQPCLEIQTTDNYVDWSSRLLLNLLQLILQIDSAPIGTECSRCWNIRFTTSYI